MQNDIFLQTMTVRKMLRFAADLKLTASSSEKEETINELAKDLKLENCMDTLIGGMLIKGISGGEKKRTSIAYELISDPPVIMLDEPTSGLDSLTSYVIVKHLNDLARDRSKTVIMTIHQPNSEISTYSISSSSWSNNYSIYQLYEESTVDISYVLFFPVL
jgi:ABC-type multidrug transport system ATPase subunit